MSINIVFQINPADDRVHCGACKWCQVLCYCALHKEDLDNAKRCLSCLEAEATLGYMLLEAESHFSLEDYQKGYQDGTENKNEY